MNRAIQLRTIPDGAIEHAIAGAGAGSVDLADPLGDQSVSLVGRMIFIVPRGTGCAIARGGGALASADQGVPLADGEKEEFFVAANPPSVTTLQYFAEGAGKLVLLYDSNVTL